jgi:hypothetical protein
MVYGLTLVTECSRFGMQDAGFRIQGQGFRIYNLGLRVKGL